MNSILLIEDDVRLALLVKEYLESSGYRVHAENDGRMLIELINKHDFDVVILDLNLPGRDGLNLCKELRPVFDNPILILTARDSDEDQILGLEFGADDYVIKPIEPSVLLARIKALLRRSRKQVLEPISISYDSLLIDCSNRRVTIRDQVIDLSCHEYDLLILLAGRAGEVISREYLFNAAFGRPYDGLDRAVDVRISHLRKKLVDAIGAGGDVDGGIKTVWGRGYLFLSNVWKL